MDSPLQSTVQKITADCPQFRILVMGKTGCGKSSLINQVFGVSDAKVSHDVPGKADINHEFSYKDNIHFILHDSQGFEPGEKANFNIVKTFIEERSKMPNLKDRLHAIWICASVPLAGDRVTETGVEEIIKMDRGGVPLMAVFTKYDTFITSAILEALDDDTLDLTDEETQAYGEEQAKENFERVCVRPLRATVGNVGLAKVSIQPRYQHTVAELIKATDQEIQRHMNDSSHSQPASLAWAIAQRGNSDTNIKASIDVGRKKYWSGLLAATDFTGKKLQQCIDIIHIDVVSVWNIRDPGNYLAGEDFKARMSGLVNDLVVSPRTPTSGEGLSLTTVTALATATASPFGIAVAAVGSAVLFAKWVLDVYQNTPHNIACVMGYVVDLTVVMHRLFTGEVSEERVVTVLDEYSKSGEIAQVHNDIRKFVNSSGLRHGVKDYVLSEIIRLIEKHCADTQ